MTLPEFWTPEPIEAWKVVLHSTDDWMRKSGWPAYMAPHQGKPVYVDGPVAAAECALKGGWMDETAHSNPAPVATCSCGWYSWKKRLDAELGMRRLGVSYGFIQRGEVNSELWRVELSGVVIEHQRGYRSQYVRWVEAVA